MVKKKSTRGKASEKAASRKVYFQVRLEPDVHQQLKKAAEEAGISLNQLIEGICEGAVGRLVQGEPAFEGGRWTVKPQKGCVFFGTVGRVWTENDEGGAEHLGERASHEIGDVVEKGAHWFTLDYSGRPVRY